MILWSSLSLVCLNRYFVRTRGKVTLIMHQLCSHILKLENCFFKIIATSTFLLRFSLFKVAGLMQSGKQQLLSLLSLIFGLRQSLWQKHSYLIDHTSHKDKLTQKIAKQALKQREQIVTAFGHLKQGKFSQEVKLFCQSRLRLFVQMLRKPAKIGSQFKISPKRQIFCQIWSRCFVVETFQATHLTS